MTAENVLMCLGDSARAIPNTLTLLAISLAINLALGILVAAGRTYRLPVIAPALDAITVVFKGIPIPLVIIVVNVLFIGSFDSVAEGLGLKIRVASANLTAVAVTALALGGFAHMSENIRGALLSVDKGQYEAGHSVGFTDWQTFRYIAFPQMSVVAIPPVINSANSLLKATALSFTIGVPEILNASIRTASRSYCYLEAYIAAAIIFWGISVVISLLGGRLESLLGTHRRKGPPSI